MGNLSTNLSRQEVECSCDCGNDSMDSETVEVFQGCCDHFARSLGTSRVVAVINSGDRCLEYNRSPAVGSNDNSQHPKSRALDFRIVGVSPIAIYSYLDTKHPNKYGIGLYPKFVHLDTRTAGPARWQA